MKRRVLLRRLSRAAKEAGLTMVVSEGGKEGGPRPRYRVTCHPDGRFWFIKVPELDGVFSQARRLGEVETMARDVIGLMLEVADDSFDIVIEPILGIGLTKKLDQMRKAREDSEAARERAARLTAETAAALVDSGLTVRDAGQILGLSFQRVAQLVEAARR